MTDDKLTALGDPENFAYDEVKRLDGIDTARPIYSPVCSLCRHLDRSSAMGAETCDAFPGGILPAIWFGANDHTAPVEGDHGIQFEPIEK